MIKPENFAHRVCRLVPFDAKVAVKERINQPTLRGEFIRVGKTRFDLAHLPRISATACALATGSHAAACADISPKPVNRSLRAQTSPTIDAAVVSMILAMALLA
jgi:hypothetical protein